MKNLFCGCPLCTHLSHSHWVEQHFQQLLYSHMIRSLLIEFGQARQDNIWSSATKLSQWIHNTLSTTVKERHVTFFTIHVIMDVCSKGFIAGAHLQKAKTMYWFRSFVFGNSHPPLPPPLFPPPLPLHPFFNSVV